MGEYVLGISICSSMQVLGDALLGKRVGENTGSVWVMEEELTAAMSARWEKIEPPRGVTASRCMDIFGPKYRP